MTSYRQVYSLDVFAGAGSSVFVTLPVSTRRYDGIIEWWEVDLLKQKLEEVWFPGGQEQGRIEIICSTIPIEES